MELKIINNKAEWDGLLKNMEGCHFLQSFEWGELLAAVGRRVERLAVFESGVFAALAQVVYYRLPFGYNYAFCPKGPVLKCRMSPPQAGPPMAENDEYRMDGEVYKCLIDYLRNKKCVFFRIEPRELPNFAGEIREVKDVNPPATLALDVTRPLEEVLAGFHHKTRYNLALAERKGLIVSNNKNFKDFWQLYTATARRDGFNLHLRKSYELIINSDSIKQRTIFFGDQAIAAACFIGFNDTLYYLYGASDHNFRQLMAPYLAQWEGIKLAKELGLKYYDFFGIAPDSRKPRSERDFASAQQERNVSVIPNPIRMGEESLSHSKLYETEIPRRPRGLARDDSYEYDPKHRYAGVTRFKLGFGGEVREDPGTFDLIISPIKYKIYQVLRWLRSLI